MEGTLGAAAAAGRGQLELPESSDGELLVRSRRGDRAAFTELVERHQDAVVNYLARLTADRDRAEELAQETFVRLYTRSGAYRDQGRLRAYLYRIAANLVRSQHRRERRWKLLRPLLAPAGGAPPREPAQERRVERRELRRRLADAIAALPLHYREPLVLHELEGWPQERVAEHLGCPPGTVKSRLHRARAKLRQELADLDPGGDA